MKYSWRVLILSHLLPFSLCILILSLLKAQLNEIQTIFRVNHREFICTFSSKDELSAWEIFSEQQYIIFLWFSNTHQVSGCSDPRLIFYSILKLHLSLHRIHHLLLIQINELILLSPSLQIKIAPIGPSSMPMLMN